MNKLEDLERYKDIFENNIQKTKGCFYWIGKIDSKTGRGKFKAGKFHKNVTAMAWEMHNKELIPEGFMVKHTCEQKLCVRPSHLELSRKTFPWCA